MQCYHFAILSMFVFISSVCAHDEPGHFVVSDIEWDIDSVGNITEKEKNSIKVDIVEKILHPAGDLSPGDDGGCNCPKILGPVICDSDGKRNNNICEFQCVRVRNPNLLPKKIILDVKWESATGKLIC